MAINLDFLEGNKLQDKTKEFYYADILLDFKLGSDVKSTPYNINDSKQDVSLLYDEKAIYQSIINIFSTRPGEKILNPRFGLYLEQYLFEPISKEMGQVIGNYIREKLSRYEPRINIKNINIIARPKHNEYKITLVINIPLLDETGRTLSGTLNRDTGFRYE